MQMFDAADESDSQIECKMVKPNANLFDSEHTKQADTSAQDASPDVLDDSWVTIKAVPVSSPTEQVYEL